MNWTKHSYPSNLEAKQYAVKIKEDSCEHCKNDNALVYVIVSEVDSFGPVCEFVMCEACFAQSQKEEQEKEVVCHDCRQTVKQSATRIWKWYDFYAEQGDEPLCICKECWELPSHKSRMSRDRYEREQEEASYRRY